MSRLCCGRNGVVALSGALVLFADGPAATPFSARWHEEIWPTRQLYPAIEQSDLIVGCDVTGDLLLLRGAQILRLDGEIGDISPLASTVGEFLGMDIETASDAVGGKLAREGLAGLALGPDPLRLLPTVPFTIGDTSPRTFQKLPLSQALRIKAQLHDRLSQVDDGDTVRLDFWPG
jgi:hypothetical protein